MHELRRGGPGCGNHANHGPHCAGGHRHGADEGAITPAVIFGGLIGATWIAAGTSAVEFGTIFTKVVVPAIASPLIAGLVAAIGTYLVYVIARSSGRTRSGFRHGQVISASLVSLAHRANDAQKTMGVITLTLITAGVLAPDAGPPFWVILTAGLAIAAGAYLGGWRIIRTVGHRLTTIEPQQASPPRPVPPPSSWPARTSATRFPPRRSRPAR